MTRDDSANKAGANSNSEESEANRNSRGVLDVGGYSSIHSMTEADSPPVPFPS